MSYALFSYISYFKSCALYFWIFCYPDRLILDLRGVTFYNSNAFGNCFFTFARSFLLLLFFRRFFLLSNFFLLFLFLLFRRRLFPGCVL